MILRAPFKGLLKLARCYSTVNEIQLSKTRNIGIIAHIDAGKTTTTERMIYYSGKSNRIGNVDEGDTVTDYLPSERERGITIQSAAITIPWNNHKINIIDTPGHADFTFEVMRSLRVLDGAVTILDAVAGVEAQTEKVWKQASSLKLPRIVYINKMDRPGAGFSRTLKEVIQKLETRVVLCNIPYFEAVEQEMNFRGVIDVIHGKLLKWKETDESGKDIEVVDVNDASSEVSEIYIKAKEYMVETLGDYDDAIIDAFLANNEQHSKLDPALIMKTIRNATIDNFLTPVFCGASFRNIGVQPLMDGITSYLPSPLQTVLPEIQSKKKKDISKKMGPSGLIFNNDPRLTVGLVFKMMTHATRGPMTFIRVYSGKLVANTSLVNTRTGKKHLIRKLLIMHGDQPEEVKHIGAGNIGVIPGYDTEFQTGDTIVASSITGKKTVGAMESTIKLMPIDIPPSLFNSCIEPHTAGDEAHMKKCLDILVREDPSLKVHVDEQMGQTILSGMGELHLEIVRDRLINDMKAKADLRDVAVAFKESYISKKDGTSEYESEDIQLKLTLRHVENCRDYEETEGAVISEDENNVIIVPDSATSNSVKTTLSDRRWKCPHSLEQLKEAIANGCLTSLQTGGPVLGLTLHSTLVEVEYWNAPVGKNEELISVLMNAAREAIQKVKSNESNFDILEPIMKVKVYVDSADLGEVSHDLSQRCQATILSVEDESIHNIENVNWANEEAAKAYLPPDYTLSNKNQTKDYFSNKKVIKAEAPLRDMVGYLSKLRALTQGRATFDMTYIGMKRVPSNRLESITSHKSV
ncbi:MEF2 [Candida oxycetoniae]|uniref:Ribosome-releasing factor 2, mitochondrial n=1 Tax=Candida oxycetoniae TaxID=497107 RepID=A0AAI9WZG1_9ASCO|nr:MEF2 [Candida oxycetoniae]KAI3405875.2 MEF2 [Candida oxycetoniae]